MGKSYKLNIESKKHHTKEYKQDDYIYMNLQNK